jgi:hypothetical protein
LQCHDIKEVTKVKAPVIVFAYNRKEHLEKTLAALEANQGARETDLFVYIDAPRESDRDVDKNREVFEFIKGFRERVREDKAFNSITVVPAIRHKGLANSVIGGVTEVINRYGRVIVVEDDIVTSPYFLKFMNEALDYYDSAKKVWSISGYTLPLPALEDYSGDGATWKDRWAKNDWEVKSFKSFDRDYKKRRRFNRGGRDLSFQLDRQMLGWIDSWAIRWGYNEYVNDCVTIYPTKSYVDNRGFDGTGTHFGQSSSNYDTSIRGGETFTLTLPAVDKKLARQFQDRYSENHLPAWIKEVAYCLGIYKVK